MSVTSDNAELVQIGEAKVRGQSHSISLFSMDRYRAHPTAEPSS